jgi:hypothetical protein
MQHRVTAEASRLISEEKKAGRSSREVARILQERLGITLDQRTISRYAARTATKSPKSAPKPPPTVQKILGSAKPPQASPPEGPTLDEIAALERQALKLQELLDGDLPPRDHAAICSELRQTFNSLRSAKHAQKEAKATENADVTWMKKKLMRFAESKRQETKAPDAARPEVSAERDSASG